MVLKCWDNLLILEKKISEPILLIFSSSMLLICKFSSNIGINDMVWLLVYKLSTLNHSVNQIWLWILNTYFWTSNMKRITSKHENFENDQITQEWPATLLVLISSDSWQNRKLCLCRKFSYCSIFFRDQQDICHYHTHSQVISP